MLEPTYNYYRINPGTQTFDLAMQTRAINDAVKKLRYEYLESKFGVDSALVKGDNKRIEAVEDLGKNIPGMRPFKKREGFIYPNNTKLGKAIRKEWDELEYLTFDKVFDYIQCSKLSFTNGYLCRPMVLIANDTPYFYEVSIKGKCASYPDMTPIKKWELEKAIEEHNESLKDKKEISDGQ